MLDALYQKADDLVKSDKIKDAVPAFKMSLKNRNFDSAYRLGLIYLDCYEKLGLSQPDYTNALQYFQMGAMNNHPLCKKELGYIYIKGPQKYRNEALALKWIVESNCYNINDINFIVQLIKHIKKNTCEQPNRDIESTIKIFTNLISTTKHPIILRELKKASISLTDKHVENILFSSSTYECLKRNYNLIERLAENDKSIAKKYLKLEVESFLKESPSLKQVSEFINIFKTQFPNVSKKENVNEIYLYIARSYRYGNHGVTSNVDKASMYYDKIGNYVGNKENSEMFWDLCQKAIQDKNLELAKKYKNNIRFHEVNQIASAEVKKLEEELYFNKIKEKSINNYEDKLKLANLYKLGKGCQKDMKLYFSIIEELYFEKATQSMYDELFIHYKETKNAEGLQKLLDFAKISNLTVNPFEEMTTKIIKHPWKSINYSTKQINDGKSIKDDDDVIYYLFDYYKSRWVDYCPNDINIRNNHNDFISLKNKHYNRLTSSLDFPGALSNVLKDLTDDYIICAAPGHERTNNNNNGVFEILKLITLKPNFLVIRNLIQRTSTIEKKSTSLSRINNALVELKTIALGNGVTVKDKSIIILDDITTSGTTLIACKHLLMEAGAKKVIPIAFGRTKEGPHDNYYFNIDIN